MAASKVPIVWLGNYIVDMSVSGLITKGVSVTSNTNGGAMTVIRNPNSGSSAYAGIQLQSDSALTGIFQNSSTNTAYGGASSFNIITVQNVPMAFGNDNAISYTVDVGGRLATRKPLRFNQTAAAFNVGATGTLTSTQLTSAIINAGSKLNLITATGAFNLDEMAAGADGQLLVVVNATGQTMTVRNTASVGGIMNRAGNSTVPHTSAALFMYENNIGRWINLSF